jgi:putative ABC transport system permease protein
MRLHLKSFFLNLVRKRKRDEDLDDEVRGYAEMLMEEKMREGMKPEEARRAARIELGGVEQVKEQVREVRAGAWLDSLLQDVRYGARTLRKSPGFTAVAVLTLALGIGANTAIFSVVNSVLLRPLPYPDSGRLVWITEALPPPMNAEIVSGGDYLDWRDQSRSLQQLAAFDPSNNFNLTGGGQPQRVHAALVTANFLQALETSLAQGRPFSQEEDRPKANPVAIVTRGLWDQRFGAGTPLSNQTLDLDGTGYSIVGILPADFRFPLQPEVQVLVPFGLDPVREHGPGPWAIVNVIGRLLPGVTLEQAAADLTTIHQRVQAAREAAAPPPRSGGHPMMFNGPQFEPRTKITPLHEYLAGDMRPELLLLLVAVGVVLLIGCVNLANLLLARSATRTKEFAIRAALGAGRKRLLAQMLTESCLLGLLGGAIGLLIGFGGMRLFLVLLPAGPMNLFLQQVTLELDGRVMLFALALSLLTGILFGLVPAFAASRTDVNYSLKEGKSGVLGGHRRNPIRSLLIVSELALALVLLTGAGLLLKSLCRLIEVNPGFQPENVLTATFSLPYTDASRQAAFCDQLLQRLNSLPGVEAAGLTDTLPLFGAPNTMMLGLQVKGEPPPDPRKTPVITVVAISPGYFNAIGMRLERGRVLTDQDKKDPSQVVVVSAALAEHFFAKKDPLDQQVKTGGMPNWHAIVGEVEDVRRSGLDAKPELVMYLPLTQGHTGGTFSIAVRGRIDAASLSSAVRSEVASLDSELPLYNVATMEKRISTSISPRRFNALLLAMFAGLALILAAVGIYGVISFGVAQRTHEIGVRMALGAQPSALLRLVIVEGMSVALVGIAIGVAGAFGVMRFIRSFLFEVSATDPSTFAAVAAVLVIVALAACYIPARRATRVDPMVALRHE